VRGIWGGGGGKGASRDGLEQGQEAKQGVGADGGVGANAGVGCCGAQGDGVAAFEVGNGAGGDLADAALESGNPGWIGAGVGVDRIDDVLDVATRLACSFAQDELVGQGALAPVDVAGVIAFTHGADPYDLVADTSAHGSGAGMVASSLVGGENDGVDRWVDDELAVGGKLARLFEEAEWEAGCHAETDMAIASAASRSASVGGNLCGVRADLEEEAAFVRRLAGA
jgi:hypothetical protein